jgi:hypothetical protein
MRLITVRRPFSEGDTVPFYLWSDWHRGNANCCKPQLLKDRDEIANSGGLYASLGDLYECINYDDPRFDPADVDWDIFEPADMGRYSDAVVADRVAFESPVIGQCVASLWGNHDGKFSTKHHTDVNLRALERMDAAGCAARGAVLLRIVFTDEHRHACQVVMNLHHGRRIAKYKSTLLNNLLIKLRHWDGVDILARGHCHFTGAESEARVTYDQKFRKLRDKKVYAALSGGYLKTYQEDGHCYAEDMDLDPIDIGMQRFVITPSRYGATIQAVTG